MIASSNRRQSRSRTLPALGVVALCALGLSVPAGPALSGDDIAAYEDAPDLHVEQMPADAPLEHNATNCETTRESAEACQSKRSDKGTSHDESAGGFFGLPTVRDTREDGDPLIPGVTVNQPPVQHR